MEAIFKDFDFYSARNAEHVYFHENASLIFTESFASTYGLTDLREQYIAAVTAESAKHVSNPAYLDTPELQSLDRARDNVFYLIAHVAEAYLSYAFKTEDIEAANLIVYLMSPYRKAAAMSYLEETAVLADFYSKLLSDEYAEALATLHLSEAAAEGKRLNDEFNELYKKRSAEVLGRTVSATMKELRTATDTAFKALADAVNALYLVYATITKDETKAAELKAVIDGVNALIVQLRQVIQQRGGNANELPDSTPVTPDTDDSSSSTEEDDMPEEL